MTQKRINEMSVAEFVAAFPNKAACNAFLLANRWPDGVRCPRCGTSDVCRHDDGDNMRWQCLRCTVEAPHSFSLRTGTIFENTSLSLRAWLSAVHLLMINVRSLAPAEIQGLLGLSSVQVAWHVCRSVRNGLADRQFRAMIGLSGPSQLRFVRPAIPATAVRKAPRAGKLFRYTRPPVMLRHPGPGSLKPFSCLALRMAPC